MATRAPTPALYQALNNWQQRAQIYNQLGIPQAHWYQIAINDIQNVANTGAAPMATTDINAAMASQLAGRTLVGNPQHHSHGLLGDIGHLFTSIPSDVKGLVTGFLPGLAHFAAHIPSELTQTVEYLGHTGDTGWLQAHGYTDPHGNILHHVAADVANIAHTPLGGLIPGMADIANLETSAGRQYLLSHPLTAALDVAPAGRIMGLGARGAVAAGLMKAGEEGTAREAVLAGRPFRAAARTVIPAKGRASIAELTDRLGVGDQAKELFAGKSQMDRKMQKKALELARPLNDAVAKLSLEERNDFTDQATLVKPRTGEYDHLISIARQLQSLLNTYSKEIFVATKGRAGTVTRKEGAGEVTFGAQDRVARHIRRLDWLDRKVIPKSRQKTALAQNAETLARAKTTKLQAQLDAVKYQAATTLKPAGRRIAQLQTQLDKANRWHMVTKTRLTNSVARHDRIMVARKQAHDSYIEGMFEQGGSAAMHPQVKQRIRGEVAARVGTLHQEELGQLHPLNDPKSPLYDPTSYQARIKDAVTQYQGRLLDVKEASSEGELRDALVGAADRSGSPEAAAAGKAMYDGIRRDAIQTVFDLIRHGQDPIWLRHVEPGSERRFDQRVRLSTVPDHVTAIRQYMEKVLNFSPHVNDMALGFTSAAVDLFRSLGTDELLRQLVVPRLKTVGEVKADYLKLARLDKKRPATMTVDGWAQELSSKEWKPIDLKRFGVTGSIGRFGNKDQLLAPRWLAENLERMMPKDPTGLMRLPFRAAWDKPMRVYRVSVLTGPRHFVHQNIAGLVPLMMEQPFSPLYFKQALDMWREIRAGKHEDTYARLSKNLFGDITDGVYTVAVGKQLGGMLRKFWMDTGGKVHFARKLAHLEETISDIYRISAALANEKIGRMGQDEAIARANKVAVDMDDMTPFERTTLKQVFPFYGFTKFLFRFLLTYPVDHPWRVAILSRFATQEQQDWNSLIPEKFMLTMFLGQPDSHGNIKTVDLRNLNPFRSFSNDMTLAGFFQDLNPLFSAALEMRGFNILSATGPLYPSLEYNAFTGTQQVAPPAGKDQLTTALQQFIPEFGALDHFIGLTDQMRILKKSNPAAYRSQLYSSLNLPGIFAPPIGVNLPLVEEKAEMARYKNAASAVSAYEEGKPAPHQPADFTLVPYQGQYVDPAAFEQYWQQLVAGAPAGINPKAITSTPIRKTSQDPLEILAGLQSLPAPPAPHY